MTYSDKYPHCIGCPVYRYCGTAVSSTRLCHAYNDSVAEKERQDILPTSEAALEEEIPDEVEIWEPVIDNY